MAASPERSGSVFLETSAELARYVEGGPESIEVERLLVDAERVATSPWVAAEIEELFGGIREGLLRALDWLLRTHAVSGSPGELVRGLQSRVRSFGRQGLLGNVYLRLLERMLGEEPEDGWTPDEARRFCANYLHLFGQDCIPLSCARAGGDGTYSAKRIEYVADRSSCSVHELPGSCAGCPCDDCALARTCVESKPAFIEACRVVARSLPRGLDRVNWNREIDLLEQMEPGRLIRFLATPRGRNRYGDILIYFEAPDGFNILSRDRAFMALNEAGPRMGDVGHLQVRPQRRLTDRSVVLHINGRDLRVRVHDETYLDFSFTLLDPELELNDRVWVVDPEERLTGEYRIAAKRQDPSGLWRFAARRPQLQITSRSRRKNRRFF